MNLNWYKWQPREEWSLFRDGLRLQAYSAWVEHPSSVLVWCHGLGGRASSFSSFAQSLSQGGMAVAAMDLRGHGSSGGKRGVADHRALYLDLKGFSEQVRKGHEDLPMLVGGHSLGGALAARLLLEEPGNYAGGVLFAPWLRLCRQLGWLRPGLKLGARLFPGLTVHNGLKSELLVRDSYMQRRIAEDSLRHQRIGLGLLHGALLNGEYCLGYRSPCVVPIGLWQGEADTVTCAVTAKEWAYRHQAYIELLAGVRHEVHWEIGQAEMARRVLAWWEEARKRQAAGKDLPV